VMTKELIARGPLLSVHSAAKNDGALTISDVRPPADAKAIDHSEPTGSWGVTHSDLLQP
jgi:hypothetical protein